MTTKGLKYPAFPWWRRVTCHIMPAATALVLGAVLVMATDRNVPVEIVWGKIVPPSVLAGQAVTFHYGSIKRADYGGRVKRWIVDAHSQVFPLTDTATAGQNLPLNREGEMIKDFVVPCGISVGLAQFHSEASLYTWWNVVQWFVPVHREMIYPFTVLDGSAAGVCAGHSGAQGPQGVQGIPGKGERGAQGVQGVQGEPGRDQP